MRRTLGPVIVSAAILLPPSANAETVPDILAAQVRIQGYACDKAVGATQDRKRSRPDHEVWVLKCSNATYRFSRFPDMAAKVEILRSR
jgi:hypothetical protein